jgi:hypothetical protein
MTPPVKTPEEFLLAVICPLEVEALAMIRQLDEDKDYGEEFSKDCNFTLGGIGEHNIVITSLPAGRQGHTSAAGNGEVPEDHMHCLGRDRWWCAFRQE